MYDFANQLIASKDFFDRSTRVLEETDSGFRPQDQLMTVAQQVAHVAQTLDWFVDGVSRTEGFDLDFEKHAKEVNAVTSWRRRGRGSISVCESDRIRSIEERGGTDGAAGAGADPRRAAHGRHRVGDGGAYGAPSRGADGLFPAAGQDAADALRRLTVRPAARATGRG